jgi:ribosomal protein S18 acetylase RimI-like enzyme
MDEYTIRKVTHDDFGFLADTIIWAEKGNSGKLSFATLLDLDENSVKDLIISMLKEDIDGCEFSPSSYLVADYSGLPVAAVGAWIEQYDGNLPSKILKSNLLSFFLNGKQIQLLKSKFHLISDMVIEREEMTLQAEYMYVARAHRGKGLHVKLTNAHLIQAFSSYPELSKAQAHVFENNYAAIKVFEEIGFRKVRSYTSDSNEILNYLPHNTKILMEKDLKQMAYGKE